MHPDSEDEVPPDASQWLYEYVCIRLAEHYPDLWDALSPEAVVIILELALDGMASCPNEDASFHSHLSFVGPLDDEIS